MKAKAMKILTFAVKDYLIVIVIEHEDHVDAQKAFKHMYESRDLAMVLISTINYLH